MPTTHIIVRSRKHIAFAREISLHGALCRRILIGRPKVHGLSSQGLWLFLKQGGQVLFYMAHLAPPTQIAPLCPTIERDWWLGALLCFLLHVKITLKTSCIYISSLHNKALHPPAKKKEQIPPSWQSLSYIYLSDVCGNDCCGCCCSEPDANKVCVPGTKLIPEAKQNGFYTSCWSEGTTEFSSTPQKQQAAELASWIREAGPCCVQAGCVLLSDFLQ